jgi:hypothetical protein
MDTDRLLRMQAAMVAALFFFYVVAAACAEADSSRACTEVGYSSEATVAVPLAGSIAELHAQSAEMCRSADAN